jgi:glycosyltransferase involved in cell wall biosynthesis
MGPKLSVITINYNDVEGLRNTMKSVFCQSFSDFEYIAVDGGSTDGSLDVIREFQAHNTGSDQGANFKFQWISEPDSGIYNAMNKGILRSNGDYCFFLNSGDYFVSQNVLKNVMQIQSGEDLLFGNMLVCLNGKVIEKCTGKPILTFMDLYLSIIKHQASFIKRSLFDKFGLYNESNKIVSDWEFFIKTVGLQNASYRYIDEDITFFDNNGISNNSRVICISERNKILENNIPPMILADYWYYEKYEFLRPAFKYKLTLFALRIIAKCAKEFERFRKKQ